MEVIVREAIAIIQNKYQHVPAPFLGKTHAMIHSGSLQDAKNAKRQSAPSVEESKLLLQMDHLKLALVGLVMD